MRWMITALAAAALVAGVVVLRDATLSTHQPVPDDSRLAVVVEARIRGGERGQTLEEMTEAQLLACRLEVTTDPVGPLEPLGDGRFRLVLQPSLDDTDRRQFRGCLEDWAIDHFQLDVEAMTEL
jgi:hypothetical protein